MDEARFERFLQRLKDAQIVGWGRWHARGCPDDAIAALERHYGVRLPATYLVYLFTMGHSAGRLFRCDHLAVTLDHVKTMTDEVRARMAGAGAQPLPDDAMVILGRLGAYFQYIRCEDAEDSPVWDLDEGDWQRHPVPIHASLLDWLDYWYEECEMAIATGYFDWSPDGTDP